jgi:hypothetical protein
MLDLLPASMWDIHPSATFLEPAAGDGNFLVAILARKLKAISTVHAEGRLPAGRDLAAVEFHALEALSSIYGIDISTDNIVGGTPGHEVGAKFVPRSRQCAQGCSSTASLSAHRS